MIIALFGDTIREYDLFVLTNQWRMAVCEFGVIKRLLYKEKSVPQEILAICEFGVIKGGDRSGENCIYLDQRYHSYWICDLLNLCFCCIRGFISIIKKIDCKKIYRNIAIPIKILTSALTFNI